ncbi:hypothetical protein MNEG_16330 [Monoraphidium neglectum]|jgi:hypothetical protein|uniref:Uncharacterized protein n=1 Tax=Monoraphidium neglectum TaxID=145388 RepID=A0A0D2LHZ5_9CHLO|nr:hypothetical protein MNEG_16330 [Monoraphidium neglectum]KIY91634.1 hypothetical protein MNEG_16330 [Monoraphidium neglectum]|eukprot:XP_013890654.1 hypothetical protein MNEG_16330 [Monoraphidium neglectum]
MPSRLQQMIGFSGITQSALAALQASCWRFGGGHSVLSGALQQLLELRIVGARGVQAAASALPSTSSSNHIDESGEAASGNHNVADFTSSSGDGSDTPAATANPAKSHKGVAPLRRFMCTCRCSRCR